MQKLTNGNQAEKPGTRPNVNRYFLALAALLVCLLIIYWPSFLGSWYLDDFGNIHENPNVHLTALTADQITQSFYGMDQTHSHFNRPLSYFSLALNYYFGSTDPFGYHVVNFLIHYTTAVFLFFLTLNILNLTALNGKYEKDAFAIALLSSFLWATHPIQVNAVTYIVQRMASLAGLFTVLSLYCYLKARVNHRQCQVNQGRVLYGWYAACVIAGGCAVASKQNAAMLPFSLLLFEILLIRTVPLSRQARQVLKLLIQPAVIFLLMVVFLGGLSVFNTDYSSRPFTLAERVLTQPRVIFFYIFQLLHPSGAPFALLHDIQVSTSAFVPWTTLPAILLLISSIGVCLLFCRKWPLFAFCYLFFFLNHAIEGSFIPLELIFEHRNYLPSLFFFLLPAIGLMKVLDYFSYSTALRVLATFGALVWICGQAHTTYVQNTLYSHPVAFWTNNVHLYPNLHRPRHNLARSLLVYGLYDEAEKQMYKSLDGKSSGRVSHKYITHYNLGVYYLYKGKYPQALNQFSVILKTSPNHVKTLQKTAELYLEIGKSKKALDFIDKALAHAPRMTSLHIIKGFVLLSRGQIDAAFSEAALASSSNHHKLGAAYIRGEGYRLKHDLEQAIGQFDKVILWDHNHLPALLSLVELFYLTENASRLFQSLAKWQKVTAFTSDKNQESILTKYNQRWNFVGGDRMNNLKEAMEGIKKTGL